MALYPTPGEVERVLQMRAQRKEEKREEKAAARARQQERQRQEERRKSLEWERNCLVLIFGVAVIVGGGLYILSVVFR